MRSFCLIAFLFFATVVKAQPAADSAATADSLQTALRQRQDSLRLDSLRLDSLFADSLSQVQPPIRDTLRPAMQFSFASDSFLYRKRLFFSFTNPVRYSVSEKAWQGKEMAFYSIALLFLLFALLKNAFSRYLSDLYSSYFRTTVRQKQIQEQLMQSPLPSLLFNLFFVISGAVFVSLLAERFGVASQYAFAVLVLYCALGLAAIYGLKFLLLKFFGWVVQLPEAASAYLLIVFSTNKVLGIFLLPLTVMLAFSYGSVNAAVVTLSIVLVIAFFAYRFFLAFISMGNFVKINFFHFLLYFAAFEVLPLLLINKALLSILREMA